MVEGDKCDRKKVKQGMGNVDYWLWKGLQF